MRSAAPGIGPGVYRRILNRECKAIAEDIHAHPVDRIRLGSHHQRRRDAALRFSVNHRVTDDADRRQRAGFQHGKPDDVVVVEIGGAHNPGQTFPIDCAEKLKRIIVQTDSRFARYTRLTTPNPEFPA